jgi:hypothetical protein
LKKAIIILLFNFTFVFAQGKTSEISSMPGAFVRMGFGAKSMGMGNAVSAINEGNMVAYYNPALSVFQEENSFQASYSFLSLDRSLNFVNFTRRFDFKPVLDTTKRKSKPAAGISIGLINSGVSKIDGRDNSGMKTGDLSTSENMFFLNVSNRFSDRISFGITVKFFYYKLYENIKSNGLGLDIGLLYIVNNHMNISLAISDINSKYKWDTTPIYQEEGNSTENVFPVLKKIGVSYKFDNPNILACIEFENSNGGTNIIRAGVEYGIWESFYLRAGIDKWNLSNSDFPARPSFGFSFAKPFKNLSIDYAFVMEPYSPSDQHILGVNFTF